MRCKTERWAFSPWVYFSGFLSEYICFTQGPKPTIPLDSYGTTKVVRCYKAHKFNTLRGAFSFHAGANLDAFALTICPILPQNQSRFAECVTALQLGYDIVTYNEKDFKLIPGLRIVKPE